jgi:hypothetical protein
MNGLCHEALLKHRLDFKPQNARFRAKHLGR